MLSRVGDCLLAFEGFFHLTGQIVSVPSHNNTS
jgi:hypothetical protein